MDELTSSRREYGATDNNAADSDDESEAPPPTKKQKLIKAGLLFGLFLVIVYVILDYTVSSKDTLKPGLAHSLRRQPNKSQLRISPSAKTRYPWSVDNC